MSILNKIKNTIVDAGSVDAAYRKATKKTRPKHKVENNYYNRSLTFKGDAERRYGGSVDSTYRRMKKKSDSMLAHMENMKPTYTKKRKK